MVVDAAKVKKNSVVFYKLFGSKKYNEKSKENLKQFEKSENKEALKVFETFRKKTKNINDIKAYTKTYEMLHYQAKKKDVKYMHSVAQSKKISEITNVFVSSLLSKYNAANGFHQRSVSFVTLTLSEPQKHTDKEITKNFLEFIKHLRKVNNYIIENGKTTRKKALNIDNYVWKSETQENGNIHFHLLFDTFFNHETLRKIWNSYLNKMGYKSSYSSANINAIKNLNDVGAYVTKYLTKEPLNNEYKKKLENRQITKKELERVEPAEKYRRPVLYTSFGCSKSLKKLSYPVFCDNEIAYLQELVTELRPVELPETAPDFIKVYAGNVRAALKKCSYNLQGLIKHSYKRVFEWLYEKRDTILQTFEQFIKPVWYCQSSFNF